MTEAGVLSSLRLGDGQRRLVLYDWSHEPAYRFENLRCLDAEGRTVWIAQLPANTVVDGFVAVRIERGSAIATTWSGHALTLDVDTGRIVGSEFVK
jgi:outer membrane protein assembly factor BamB